MVIQALLFYYSIYLEFSSNYLAALYKTGRIPSEKVFSYSVLKCLLVSILSMQMKIHKNWNILSLAMLYPTLQLQ
jgi:hypothetical protein